MANTKLTIPLKTWTDGKGGAMHRLGDLPVGVEYRLIETGPTFEVVSYPRSSRTGKRQVRNTTTGDIIYEFNTKKVYVV